MSGTLRSAQPGVSGSAGPERGFIPVDELAALVMRRVPILLIDARFTLEEGPLPDEYQAGHIPGAIFVDLERELAGPRTPSVGNYPVPEAEIFEQTARRWGLDDTTDVVVYAGYKGISAGRLSWLLRWFGHQRVRILDGGLHTWERRGYPLVPGESAPARAGGFTAKPGGVPVIDAAGAIELGRHGQLIDVRARSQYRLKVPGPTRGGRLPGRIPGAINIPSTSLHHRNGLLRTADDIAGILQTQGIDRGRPVGVYCGGGVASAWAAFTLRAAGIDAAFFTAAWAEYVADPAMPVELES
jgi:thiosulfate/3-mercaptopyruvate sulfurtransferase